ncbi:MAG: hypothetical protein ABFS86_02575 [Planctomycetota bacterium]
MTRNVTLRMDEKLLTELRHRAVDADLSLSAWITRVLESYVRDDLRFRQARERAMKRLAKGFRLGGKPLAREDAHVR